MTRDEILAVAKPILFNTEMVRAILDGRKTVTRRAVKFTAGQNPAWTGYIPDGAVLYGSNNIPAAKASYQSGDILYVRETWVKLPVSPGDHFRPNGIYYYKADEESRPERFWCNGWRPSIHMPKEAARMFLRVIDVRAERIQDITDKQIENEGIRVWSKDDKLFKYAPSDREGDAPAWPWTECPHSPKEAMNRLWDRTIKAADLPLCGWEANPWVWVIHFERVEAN